MVIVILSPKNRRRQAISDQEEASTTHSVVGSLFHKLTTL